MPDRLGDRPLFQRRRADITARRHQLVLNFSVEPNFFVLMLEGLMHAQSMNTSNRVIEKRTPIRLDEDSGILQNLLNILHQLTTFFNICDTQCSIEFFVKFALEKAVSFHFPIAEE